jgi:hypothetical protein
LLDQFQVELPFRAPAPGSFRNLRAESLVQGKGVLSKFLGLKAGSQTAHGCADRGEVVPELVFQEAAHAIRIDNLDTTNGPYAIPGVEGEYRPAAEFDPKLLAALLFSCRLRLLFIGLEATQSTARCLSVEPSKRLPQAQGLIFVEAKAFDNDGCPQGEDGCTVDGNLLHRHKARRRRQKKSNLMQHRNHAAYQLAMAVLGIGKESEPMPNCASCSQMCNAFLMWWG